MAQVTFTRHLERYLSAPPRNVVGDTVARVLACIFDANPQLRGYVLDGSSPFVSFPAIPH